MSAPDVWFTARGTIAGRQAAIVVADGRLVGDDVEANARMKEAVARGGPVQLAGIHTGPAGLDHPLQAAATAHLVFDDGPHDPSVAFDPPLPVSDLPPGAIA